MADPENPLVDSHLPIVMISFFGLTVIFGATLVVFWVLDIGMLGLADPVGVLMDPVLPMGLITSFIWLFFRLDGRNVLFSNVGNLGFTATSTGFLGTTAIPMGAMGASATPTGFLGSTAMTLVFNGCVFELLFQTFLFHLPPLCPL